MRLDLDVRDTTVLKGLAISAIVLHNYFHVVIPVRENEFTFDPTRFHLFLHTVTHPALATQAVFSFFGHFGVQIFIFLSAYGLAKSYWYSKERWGAFMWGRVKKLYPIIGVVILPWIVMMMMASGPLFVLKRIVPEILLMLTGLSNLVPGIGLPPVGPWWFIPFIIQFYAIWPLLRKLTIRFGWRGLLVVTIACMVVAYGATPWLERWHINLLETPLGRMPGLCFGILAAKYPVRLKAPLALSCASLVVLGSVYVALWPLTFTSAKIVALWTYLKVRARLRSWRFLERIGKYSMLIFLINGIVRIPFVLLPQSPQRQLFLGFVSAAVSFAAAAMLHRLIPQRVSRSMRAR